MLANQTNVSYGQGNLRLFLEIYQDLCEIYDRHNAESLVRFFSDNFLKVVLYGRSLNAQQCTTLLLCLNILTLNKKHQIDFINNLSFLAEISVSLMLLPSFHHCITGEDTQLKRDLLEDLKDDKQILLFIVKHLRNPSRQLRGCTALAVIMLHEPEPSVTYRINQFLGSTIFDKYSSLTFNPSELLKRDANKFRDHASPEKALDLAALHSITTRTVNLVGQNRITHKDLAKIIDSLIYSSCNNTHTYRIAYSLLAICCAANELIAENRAHFCSNSALLIFASEEMLSRDIETANLCKEIYTYCLQRADAIVVPAPVASAVVTNSL